jgi:hypothetical protein
MYYIFGDSSAYVWTDHSSILEYTIFPCRTISWSCLTLVVWSLFCDTGQALTKSIRRSVNMAVIRIPTCYHQLLINTYQ